MDDGEKANERGKGWLGVLDEIKKNTKDLVPEAAESC
jgi:hypothetical protein